MVSLSKAALCIANQCFPVLVGDSTPVGTFHITHVSTNLPGYGGDVLKFAETDKEVFAIHRVWLLKPSEHRLERLESNDTERRKHITHGCINVDPEVYEAIQDADEVQILP